MRLSDLARSTHRRFSRPSTWVALLGFGLLWTAIRLLAGQPFGRMGLGEFVVPTLLLAGHLAFSPLPWQWTGDERPLAPAWRGVLQALPWNAGWVLLVMLALQGFFPRNPPPRAERPPRVLDEERPEPAPPPEEGLPAPRLQEDRPPRREGPRQDRRPREARGPRNPNTPLRRQEYVIFLLNLPFSLVLGWFLTEKERAEASGAAAEAKAREAQALSLQAQLHPHALYNVLGGLTELVHEDPDAAEEALVALVEMLRTLTRLGRTSAIPLSHERALVKHYLAVEAIRLGSRLKVTWDWPSWADAVVLPPLLLQPLVENAIEHGIAPHPEGGELRIGVVQLDGLLRLRVANTGAPLDPGRKDGTGLGNLRERLALMPERTPSFTLASDLGWTLAELSLKSRLVP